MNAALFLDLLLYEFFCRRLYFSPPFPTVFDLFELWRMSLFCERLRPLFSFLPFLTRIGLVFRSFLFPMRDPSFQRLEHSLKPFFFLLGGVGVSRYFFASSIGSPPFFRCANLVFLPCSEPFFSLVRLSSDADRSGWVGLLLGDRAAVWFYLPRRLNRLSYLGRLFSWLCFILLLAAFRHIASVV